MDTNTLDINKVKPIIKNYLEKSKHRYLHYLRYKEISYIDPIHTSKANYCLLLAKYYFKKAYNANEDFMSLYGLGSNSKLNFRLHFSGDVILQVYRQNCVNDYTNIFENKSCKCKLSKLCHNKNCNFCQLENHNLLFNKN